MWAQGVTCGLREVTCGLREVTWGIRVVTWGLREVIWGLSEVIWGLRKVSRLNQGLRMFNNEEVAYGLKQANSSPREV